MALDSLVEPRVLSLLSAARSRYGAVVIERVPTAQQVSHFISELDSLTAPLRVSERLHFSERDGTVAFSHVVQQPPDAVRTLFPHRELMLRLFTVTQDYTNRSTKPWSPSSGWSQQHCGQTMQPEHLPVVNPLLHSDPALLFLLKYQNRPRYLHVVRRDPLTEHGRQFVVYTVEVAARLSDEGNVHMPALSSVVKSWPSQQNFARRRALPHEVTLWAVLNMVPAKQQHDRARLQIIRDAINAVAPFCEPPPLPLTSAPRTLHAGSMYHLLRVRHAGYQDGRARYAVASAIVNSRALMPHEKPPSPAGTRVQPAPPLRTTRDNRPKILMIAVLTLLTGALGLIYLVRLRHVDDDGVDEVVGVAIGITFGIMVPSAAVWMWLCYRCRSKTDAAEPRVAVAAEQLYNRTKNGTPTERVQAATSAASRAYYNDNWLSFTALQYTGSVDYPGRFTVSELMQAGYKTTFALDGREVLVTPERNWVRLLGLDSGGGAVFDNGARARKNLSIEVNSVQGEEDFGHRVVPQTEGEWTADLTIGCRAQLREGYNNV